MLLFRIRKLESLVLCVLSLRRSVVFRRMVLGVRFLIGKRELVNMFVDDVVIFR